MSHFLRDYLFIPLGGSRGRIGATVRNLFITMFLGGLWHGAAWTFVAWGLYHGLLLAVHALWKALARGFAMPWLLAVAITFVAVHLGWVLFRAPSFERAGEIYAGMFGMNGVKALLDLGVVSQTFGRLPRVIDIAGGVEGSFYLVLGLLLAFLAPNAQSLPRRFTMTTGVMMGVLFMLCVGNLGKDTPFIYFQF